MFIPRFFANYFLNTLGSLFIINITFGLLKLGAIRHYIIFKAALEDYLHIHKIDKYRKVRTLPLSSLVSIRHDLTLKLEQI